MGWSDWQDPWVAEFPGPDPADSRLVARALLNAPGSSFDVAAWLDSARATIMGGGGDSVSAVITANWQTEFMSSTGTLDTARLVLGYTAEEYDESDVDADVSPFGEPAGVPADADFPPDSEYDNPVYGPYIRGRIGYDGPPRGTFVAWGRTSIDAAILQTYRQFDGTDLDVVMGVPTPQIVYSWLTSIAADEWLAYPAGTVLSTDDAPVDGTTTPHTLIPAFATDDALVGITAPQLWLVAQSSFMDAAMPLPYGSVTSGVSWSSRFFNGGVNRGGQAGPFFSPGPRIQASTARWRYWLDDNVYTVGGHWADPNGVQVKRLKDDGVTWIPIVDGLAPPLR